MEAFKRPCKCLLKNWPRPYKSLIRGLMRARRGIFWGGGKGKKGRKILQEALLEGLMSQIKAKVLVMSARNAAYS